MPHHSSRLIAIAVLVGILVPSSARTHAQDSVTLATVLDRLHAYLDDYASRLPAIIASEYYVQRGGPTQAILESTEGQRSGISRTPQFLSGRARANGLILQRALHPRPL